MVLWTPLNALAMNSLVDSLVDTVECLGYERFDGHYWMSFAINGYSYCCLNALSVVPGPYGLERTLM